MLVDNGNGNTNDGNNDILIIGPMVDRQDVTPRKSGPGLGRVPRGLCICVYVCMYVCM